MSRLSPGDTAPAFSLTDDTGATSELDDEDDEFDEEDDDEDDDDDVAIRQAWGDK